MSVKFISIPESFYLSKEFRGLLDEDKPNVNLTSLFFLLMITPTIQKESGYGFFPYPSIALLALNDMSPESCQLILSKMNSLQTLGLIKFDEKSGQIAIPLKINFYLGDNPKKTDCRMIQVKKAISELPPDFRNFILSKVDFLQD